MADGKTSTVILVLKNSSLNDGDLLCTRIARALQEYVDFIWSHRAAHTNQERYVCSNGTELWVTAVSSIVTDIPRAEPLDSIRRLDVGQEPE